MKSILVGFLLIVAVSALASSVNERVQEAHNARNVRAPRTCNAWQCLTAEGQSCGFQGLTYYGCPQNFWCNESKVCAPLQPIGATCNTSDLSTFCEQIAYCNVVGDGTIGTCTAITYSAGLGEYCSPYWPYVNCAGQYLCNRTTSTCVPAPVLGESCGDFGLCGGDAYCHLDTNICTAFFSQPIGALCQQQSECLPNLYCNSTDYFPFTGACTESVVSSFDVCSTSADCPSGIEDCTCNFLPYNSPTRCEGPYTYNNAQAEATGQYYQCLYDNNCGEIVCDACADIYCNYFNLVQNVSISLYGYPELWCLGQEDVVTFVQENCVN